MSKFKSVSVRDTTFDVIDKLSNELLPKVQLSKAQTIDRIAAIAEKSMGKPVIAINTALYWHALRSMGIDDSISNFGRLLERH